MAGVAKVGNHGTDALGGCALERVHHDQQFHEVFVGGCAGRLHHENVTGSHVLFDFDGDFPVGEAAHIGSTQGGAKVLGNFSCHARIGIAGENHEVGLVGLHSVPAV
ncbi:MAG: hypothetical protein ACD_23C01222G0001 [uncultured bacterium]|nr:MAG: hypothetical protein ACD_23C01222G0001 [uncultured bacterium]